MNSSSASLLGAITGVTINVPDINAAASAYTAHMGYRMTGRGRVSVEQANAWHRPGCAGSRFVLLSPESVDDFSFRLVEAAHVSGYRAFESFGWNAAELIVRDVDELAGQLTDGPFQVLGPPQDLSFTDAIRAMQVRGPGGEILYLTQFKRALPSLPHPAARCDVDRVFIVIVGGPSLDDLVAFYSTRFQIAEPARMESRVKAMSEVFGLSPEHRYPIAALPLQERCYIEADQMPPRARPPRSPPDQLPPGIAIVSFRAMDPDMTPPGGCLIGSAGELLELTA
jgi:hypothetical protein